MKRYTFLFLLLICAELNLKAQQQDCPKYSKLLNEANQLLQKDKYIEAINKLNSAREYCPSKSKEIDAEVGKVVAAIDKKKKEAKDNAKVAEEQAILALENQKKALEGLNEALEARLKAEKSDSITQFTLNQLKTTSNQAVTLLLYEIDRNIVNLDYDSTFEKCRVALELKEQAVKVKQRIQEIAFWQVETDTADFATPLKTLALLDILPKQKDKETLLQAVKNIDTSHYNKVIWKRHFPEMVKVEGGEFMMGAKDDDENAGENEKPQHKVKLSSFYMAKTETTVWQYHLYLRVNKLAIPSPPSWQWQGDNPMVYVDWYDALEYSNWLSERLKKEQVYAIDKMQKDPNNQNEYDEKKWLIQRDTLAKGFRLPTEAEWEYAARGGSEEKNDFVYAGSKYVDSVAWYDGGNSNSRTHKVATKKGNALGIFDLSGNVWEWCNDWYGAYDSSQTDNPIGAKKGSGRVLRGGSWFVSYNLCRVSNRDGYRPSIRYNADGFRICLGTNP